MTHLRITKRKGGEDLVPIFWDDNYFPLFPGEKREISAAYTAANLEGSDAVLEVDGYNVTPSEMQPTPHP
jgi:hypothetical protein